MVTCLEVQDSLPAFVLGALDEHGRLETSSHIASCSLCRQKYRQINQITDDLLEIVPQRIPPASLKNAIMLATLPQSNNLGARTKRWLQGAIEAPRWALGSLLFAGLLVVSLVGNGFVQLSASTQSLAGQIKEQQQVLSVLTRSDRESIAMMGTAQAKEASATLMYVPGANTGVLLVQKLPPLAESQSYQLWLIDSSGKRDSGAVFSVSTDGNGTAALVVSAPRSIKDYVKCGVSIEPRGGSPKPTGPAALTGSYS